VAHTLTSINVQASTAAELLDDDPAHARTALATIEDASREAIDELRAILGVLRQGDGDAPRAPAQDVDAVAALVKRSRESGLDVALDVVGERPERVPDAVALAAFRIVQESLTNAHRHATGAPVRVSLRFDPWALVVAIENGRGTPVNGKRHAGVGIVGMTERAGALGGTLEARPVAGGFRVDAALPYSCS
jgi:signal transduction histidine kinase